MPMDRVQVVEVGPRDGLQAEPQPYSTAQKVELIERLMDAGLRRIEATSFVSPSVVPQLGDAAEVLAAVSRRTDVEISALVPNRRGLERAIMARVDRVAVFTSATETFAERNIRCSIDESFARFEPVVQGSIAAGVPVRGYVSMAWHCPYEGAVSPTDTLVVARRLISLGCDEISLADTVGRATPREVESLVRLVSTEIPVSRLAVHLHDTAGRALANVEAALVGGVRVFDAAIAGLGGCPFAPGSPGNLGTEVLVERLHALGFETGVSIEALGAAAALARPAARRAA